jgi:hypothetical protein
VDIATLKQRARDCEKRGDTAAALEAYEDILQHFESSGVDPDGPLYVKVGDLSLKTGNRTQALDMFERAAERYARLGSEKSVIALCLKVLRTDTTRTDVYVRFARSLLRYGHVEQTRLVLMDYAERAKLRKTLTTLDRLGTRSETELKLKLEKFFETVDRGAPQLTTSGERAAVAQPQPPKPISHTTEHLALMVEASASPVGRTPTAPPPLAARPELIVTDIAPMPEPVVEKSAPPAIEPAPRHVPRPVPHHEPRPQPIATRTARRRGFTSLWANRQALPVWAWPAAAAAAVVVLAVGLFALGAIPFGGDLGAEQPDGKGVAVPITRIMTAATFEEPAGPRSPGETPATQTAAVPVQVQATNPTATPGPAAEDRTLDPGAPTSLDPTALNAAREAALSLSGTAVDVPVTDRVEDLGRIKVPTGAPTSSSARRATATPNRPTASQPVIVIEGLVIEGVARMSSSYQVVQRLASGKRVSLTVVPFSQAPPDDTGFLLVRAESGDSVIGTVRFGDSYVTARAAMAPAELEQLLGRLVEQLPGDDR